MCSAVHLKIVQSICVSWVKSKLLWPMDIKPDKIRELWGRFSFVLSAVKAFLGPPALLHMVLVI